MADGNFISPSRILGGLDIQTSVTLAQSDPELAWLAGLLEGEAHFQAVPPNIVLGMTDRDVVERAMRVAQCGSIRGPLPVSSAHHNPIWRWKVSTSGDVLVLAFLLLPHMGARRARAIRKMIGVAQSTRSALVKHGTRAQYKQGCRCDSCIAAQRAYQRDRTKAAQMGASPSVLPPSRI